MFRDLLTLFTFTLFSLSRSCFADAAEPAGLLPGLGKEEIKIVCLGDSVTGVYYHTGGQRAYSEMLAIALQQLYPQQPITVVNAGISGNTTQNGLDRLDRDVLGKRPNLVTICFGLNDVARIPVARFRDNLVELVRRCRSAGSGVLLCTPNAVIETTARPIARLEEYCETIRSVGSELKVPVCDFYAAGEAARKRNPFAWRLTMSDEIHPNMAGHKHLAEQLCQYIFGRQVSLDDVDPPTPALAKTWNLLRAGKPVRVLAMPPYDKLITDALRSRFPQAAVEVTSWDVAGKTLPQIEEAAKSKVRSMKPDLVLLAVPREATTVDDEQFVRSFAWVMNWSLSFGLQEWDCLVVHPSVASPQTTHPRDDLVRRLVRAQHLHLVDRKRGDSSPAAELFSDWLRGDWKGTESVGRGREANRRLDDGLVAHWPLEQDGRDVSGKRRHAQAHGVEFATKPSGVVPRGAARFTGRDSYLEVPAAVAPKFGKGDFSISLQVESPSNADDLPGDLLSCYDLKRKRGFQLSLKSSAGVTFSQANQRHLQFGIDDDVSSQWTDCGRPGDALLAFALAVHDGALYAGTCEPAKDRSGRVYRYAGDRRWVDCGAPDAANAVTALAVHAGRLYAGTGKYRVAGSALAESENTNLGGGIFRYEGGTTWTDCGRLDGAEAVGGLVEFRGRLYASSLYKPAAFYRYEPKDRWTALAVPDGRRVEALSVFDGHLYASSYDGGRVYRFDGETWTDCGLLGDNTQTYSFAVYRRKLFVGTWPSGRVYRFDDVGRWADVGRLGAELEVMGMIVHNGRLIGGTLPLAEAYEYDGEVAWSRLAQLDTTPDVKYRRAWTMAEHQGRLFCSTLPSGRVYAFQAGAGVAWEQEFPDDVHHVAAIKKRDVLTLYVDGREVARSESFDAKRFDLDLDSPLYIGRGMNDDFRGRMSDVRLYDRALMPEEIVKLAEPNASSSP